MPVSFELSILLISALKIVLLAVKGSTALHGHHFVHLKDKICFHHVLN